MYKVQNWNSFKPLKEKIVYTPEAFGLKTYDNLGEGVKIAVIDTGLPSHPDIENVKEHINFSKRTSDDDELGHATAVCGVISASGTHLTGLAPKVELYTIKACDIELRFDACIAGVIWSMIKRVDIILLPFSTSFDHEVFRDVIKKAQLQGITVIAASDSVNSFPSTYKNVISVGDENAPIDTDFTIPCKDSISTFVDNKYAKVSGSSISAAIIAGVAARIISDDKIKGKTRSVSELIKDIRK